VNGWCKFVLFHIYTNKNMSFCVFCHDEEGPFISPCLCTGSIGLIHRACLIRWGRERCQTCQQPYQPLVLTWREILTLNARQGYDFIAKFSLGLIQFTSIAQYLLDYLGLHNKWTAIFFVLVSSLIITVTLHSLIHEHVAHWWWPFRRNN
jgi:hypothetical protein